jgi:hypothetical protein
MMVFFVAAGEAISHGPPLAHKSSSAMLLILASISLIADSAVVTIFAFSGLSVVTPKALAG